VDAAAIECDHIYESRYLVKGFEVLAEEPGKVNINYLIERSAPKA